MGAFAGLPNNATFSPAPGRTFSINYFSGAGNNDVVLTQLSVPQPALITGIAKDQLGAMQGNTNLSTTNWLDLGVVAADGNGLLQFLDNDSLVLPMRFYRFRTE